MLFPVLGAARREVEGVGFDWKEERPVLGVVPALVTPPSPGTVLGTPVVLWPLGTRGTLLLPPVP